MRPAKSLLPRLLATLLAVLPAWASAEAAMPTWQVLEFEEEAFFVTAQARIEIPQPREGAQEWELRAEGSIQSSFERVVINFAPDDLRIGVWERLSKGRDSRLKSWNYQDDFILRRRQKPSDNDKIPPRDWPLSNVQRMEYPPAAEDLNVSAPYLLLLLADRLLDEGMGAEAEVLVQTDFNFYRARLTVGPGERLRTDYRVNGGKRIKGLRHTTAVTISVEPEGQLPEKDDFNLLGLHGDVTIYFDRDNGLPLRLQGDAPRLGTTEIDLRAATLRSANT
ncbi:MAG: hypothetical protein HKN19_14355 [Halioglobus sp.]|nr:hypothetical protein [Halioglobus sp.]